MESPQSPAYQRPIAAQTQTEQPAGERPPATEPAPSFEHLPTIFHLTHWKAGSQWVSAVLQQCAPERFVKPQMQAGHVLLEPIRPGYIYSSIYLPRPLFERVLFSEPWPERVVEKPWNWDKFAFDAAGGQPRIWPSNRQHFVAEGKRYKKIVVIRDLRDTLISYYFSAKVSHEVLTDHLASIRHRLQDASKDRGLLRLIITVLLRQIAPIQLSWLDDDEALHVRYEDLITDEHAAFARIVDFCEIEVSRARLHEVVEQLSFEKRAGRQRGTEDVTAYYRKGVAGDWQNHFSEAVKAEFKKHHGDVLIQTGYEADLSW